MDLRKSLLTNPCRQISTAFSNSDHQRLVVLLYTTGFGLNVVLTLCHEIWHHRDKVSRSEIKIATSAYIADIFIDESIVSAAHLWQHFADYGLVCKDSGATWDGAKFWVGKVWGWGWLPLMETGRSKVPEISHIVTCSTYFHCMENWLATSLCAAGLLRTSKCSKNWDDEVRDASLCHMLAETMARVWARSCRGRLVHRW